MFRVLRFGSRETTYQDVRRGNSKTIKEKGKRRVQKR